MNSRRWFVEPVCWVEAFVLFNLAFLAVDIYVAHSINQFAHPAEWIPFVFSVVAPVVLIPCFPRSRASLRRGLTRTVGLLVGACSILVGIMGMVFHLESQFFISITVRSLVYTAPFVAPLSYAGLGFLLLLNRMMPTERTEWATWVIFFAATGIFGNFVLALCDHAQNGFFNWPEWIPVYVSALSFGFLMPVILRTPSRSYLKLCYWVMGLQGAAGLLGFGYHFFANLAGPSPSLWENTLYGAPIFAPLLLANLSLLAAIGLVSLHLRADTANARLPTEGNTYGYTD